MADGDSSSDEQLDARSSRAAAVLVARERDQHRVQEVRAEARLGAEPTPRAERRVSKEVDFTRDVSDTAVLAAVQTRCKCLLGRACAAPTPELIRECRLRKKEMKNTGEVLTSMLRSAVVTHGDGLVLDWKEGHVSISMGVKACPRRFFSLFNIKANMRTRMAQTVTSGLLGVSLWGNARLLSHPTAVRGERAAAWIRVWAMKVGDFPPNAMKEVSLQIDARSRDIIWRTFLHEQPEYAMTYQHFCAVFNKEAARPPVLRMRKKKDVSSPCPDCLDAQEQLAQALHNNSGEGVTVAKAVMSAHVNDVRTERDVHSGFVVSAQQSPEESAAFGFDIMDGKKTQLPNPLRTIKLRIAGAQRLPVKLLGFTHEGGGWVSFLAPPWVPKGANLTCTAIYLMLRSVRLRRGSLPPKLVFIIDGGSENWNTTVFSFFVHLVTEGIVKEVLLLRMPVGHTHGKVDQRFSRISISLHGHDSMDTGRSSNTPAEWAESVRLAFLEARCQPDIAWLSGGFDFDSLYADCRAELSGFGPSLQYTAAPGEQPRMEQERRSHLRVALIRKDPGEPIATIRFAQNAMAAERNEWYPLRPPPPPAAADAPSVWCSLDSHTGAQVLTRLPSDAPTRVRFEPEQWDKFSAFQETLSKLDGLQAWPSTATDAWREFFANPPCVLSAVPWDIALLRSAPRLAAAPAVRASYGARLLVVDPLITATRTKTQKAADEAAAGCSSGNGRFDIPFSQLEVDDFAFALAHRDAPWAFRLRVAGKTTKPLELLQIEALVTAGRKACVQATPAMPAVCAR